MNRHTIVLGDCQRVLSTLDPADVVVTSPPYNLEINYKQYKDKLPRVVYMEWMADVGKAVAGNLKSDGSFFLNMGETNLDPWLAADVAREMEKWFVLQNHIIWVKSIHLNGKTTGHFKPLNSPRFVNNNFEHIFHFTKSGDAPIDKLAIGVPFADQNNAERYGSKLSCRGNCWFLPYETKMREPTTGITGNTGNTEWITISDAAAVAQVNKGTISGLVSKGVIASNGKNGRDRLIDANSFNSWMSDRWNPKNLDHPATFPIELPRLCIKLHGVKDGMHVVDPFGGMATTALACAAIEKETGFGVRSTCIEIDQNYTRQAIERLEKHGVQPTYLEAEDQKDEKLS